MVGGLEEGGRRTKTPSNQSAPRPDPPSSTPQMNPTSSLKTQHDFAAADKSIRESMLPAAARLCAGLDATIEEGQQMMACCGARHVSTLGRLVWMVVAAVLGFAVFFALAVLLVVLSGRRRRAAEVFALPTYGLSQYSRPASRRTSWQA